MSQGGATPRPQSRDPEGPARALSRRHRIGAVPTIMEGIWFRVWGLGFRVGNSSLHLGISCLAFEALSDLARMDGDADESFQARAVRGSER